MGALFAFLPPWISAPLMIAGKALKALPWQAWVAAGVVACGLYYGHTRYDAGDAAGAARVQAEFNAYKAQVAEGDRQAREAATRLQKRQQAEYDYLQNKLTQEKQDAIAQRDAVIADLRAGTVRLRQRFRCPVPAAPAGGPAGTSAGGDAAGDRGLSDADAEFLVRFAGDADNVARQLGACQAVIRADRQGFNVEPQPAGGP